MQRVQSLIAGRRLAQALKPTVMDMRYKDQFEGAYVGDAYERMFQCAAVRSPVLPQAVQGNTNYAEILVLRCV